MLKILSLALLVGGMFLAMVAFDKNATAQAQVGAAGAARPKELVLDLGDQVTLKLRLFCLDSNPTLLSFCML